MPAMKMNDAGASTTPPEIARPLVQPPAMPAAYSNSAAAKNTISQRLTTLVPKISVHCWSGSLRHLNVPLNSADTRPPRKIPNRTNTAQVMPAGMIVVDDDGDLARKRVRSRMANRAHHNFRFTMETVPVREAEGVKKFMDNFDISKPIEDRIDPAFVTEYLLERFTIAGTPDECIAKVMRLEAEGIQRILLTPPNAIYNQVMEAWGRQVIPHCG